MKVWWQRNKQRRKYQICKLEERTYRSIYIRTSSWAERIILTKASHTRGSWTTATGYETSVLSPPPAITNRTSKYNHHLRSALFIRRSTETSVEVFFNVIDVPYRLLVCHNKSVKNIKAPLIFVSPVGIAETALGSCRVWESARGFGDGEEWCLISANSKNKYLKPTQRQVG